MRTALIISLTAITCVSAVPQEVEDPPFEVTAGLSYNGTGGNTSTHSLGVEGAAIRRLNRVHVDWGGSYLTSRAEGEKTAENMGLFASAKIFVKGERLYALYRAKWERNVFAGLEYRLSNLGGFGTVLAKSEPLTLNAEAGVNFIYEKYPSPAGVTPGDTVGPRSENFPSFHAGVDYLIDVHDIAEVKAVVGYDMSMKNAEDQLFNATGSLSVFFVDWLAVSAAESVMWDNTPREGYEKYDLTSKLGLTLRYQ
jgi:putative salt-induced outer membrane protein YdiY